MRATSVLIILTSVFLGVRSQIAEGDSCASHCLRASSSANGRIVDDVLQLKCVCEEPQFRADYKLCLDQHCEDENTERILEDHNTTCFEELNHATPSFTVPANTVSITLDAELPALATSSGTPEEQDDGGALREDVSGWEMVAVVLGVVCGGL